MAHKGAPIAASFLKPNVVESSFQVDERHVLVSTHQVAVPPGFIQLVLVFTGALVDWDDILTHPIVLPRLSLGHKQHRSDQGRVLIR